MSQQKQGWIQRCPAPVGAAAALSAGLLLTAPAPAQKVQAGAHASAARSGLGTPPGFAFVPPPGWQMASLPLPYRLPCVADPRDDAAATLSVQERVSALPVDRYALSLLAALSAPPAHPVSRGPFVTSSGLHGYRVVFDQAAPGQSVHIALYAFPGAGRRKFLCAGIWPAAENARYAGAADAAMRTFTVK